MVSILTNSGKLFFLGKMIMENMVYTGDMPGGRPTTKKAPPFGERLAVLRKQKGFSQSQLAKKLNVTREMVNYYERRAKNPTGDFVQKVATALGVSTDELLGIKPVKVQPGPKSKLEQRIDAVKALPKSKQKLVIDLLDTVLKSEARA